MATPTARFRLPPEGRYGAAAAAAVVLLGLLKGINLLLLLGDALVVVVALNAWSSARQVRGLSGRRRFVGPVFAGEPTVVVVGVANAARRVCHGLRVVAGPLTFGVPRLPAGGAVELRGRVTFPARGRHDAGAVWAVSGHPFGLVCRHRPLTPAEEVLVLPPVGVLRREQLRRRLLGPDPLRWRGPRGVVTPGAQADLRGVRDYRPGDGPRAVHWRTTARRGRLMVREYEDPPGDNLLVVLAPGVGAAFEADVALAATLCWDWGRHGGAWLGLVVAGAAPAVVEGPASPALALRALEALAVAAPGPACGGGDLAAALRGRERFAAAALVVGAAGGELAAALRRRLRRPVLAVEAASAGDFYTPPSLGLQPGGPP
jgi:uncharacterized protein (DUF58 family)